jgi:hypothetical protein
MVFMALRILFRSKSLAGSGVLGPDDVAVSVKHQEIRVVQGVHGKDLLPLVGLVLRPPNSRNFMWALKSKPGLVVPINVLV